MAPKSRQGRNARGRRGAAPQAAAAAAADPDVEDVEDVEHEVAEEIKRLLGNGPVEVGIAAGSDTLDGRIFELDDLTVETIAEVYDAADMPEEMQFILAGAIRMAAGIQGAQTAAVVVSRKTCDHIEGRYYKMGLTLALCTKIAFWQMNHHVGTDPNRLLGMAGKYMNAIKSTTGIDPNQKDVVELVWKIGHSFDTKVCLDAMGIRGLASVPVHQMSLDIGRDMRLRLQSSPAGTAKIADCAAAVRILANTTARYYVPCTNDMEMCVNNASHIMMNPVAYHVGAGYLTGSACRTFPEPLQATVEILKSALHIMFSNSTLLQAQVFKAASENREVTSAIAAGLEAEREAIKKMTRAYDATSVSSSWNAIARAPMVGPAPKRAAKADGEDDEM